MPGKRKRETAVVSRTTEEGENREPSPDVAESSHDIFRRYFESRFEPLEPIPDKRSPSTQPTTAMSEDGDEDEDENADSEWDGISEQNDDSPQVEVVEHTGSRNVTDNMLVDKKARKAFMNAKPPPLSESSTTKSTSTKKDQEDEDAMDAEDLKNDLALQRLLKESHLLESADDLNPTGKNRHKAIDLRIQSLGAKTSLYTQEKMPMSHRKGIIAKAAKKEEKRRQEARENGIILEKPTVKPKNNNKRRERGVGGPSVGKFAGGTLKLNKVDVMRIQGPSRVSKGKGKSKGRR
ncbi:hypothetical protein VTN00DRAFT_1069 [Thermoascus crustaceus]|uniref:uncharacterized protein n=1 Tax=Thermoascus crustaceus TaxID=5088 RepID=UPI0037431D4F